MQNVNGILCPSVQCSGPVLFPQESNFIAYILKMLQNCLLSPFIYLYIFVDKNIKNWYGLKSRFVWFFLRDSETLPRMPVGLCCTAGKMIFFCTWVKLSSTDLCSSTAKFWNWVHQSTLKKEKEKDLSFWIQSTFPSYQIITCPVCLDTLCNWTTKTSYRFQTSRDWYHFSTFCTGKCLMHWSGSDMDL